jgi:hypothetical protein
MDNYLIIIFLFIGGAIGWSLFGIAMTKLVVDRKREIELINDIRESLKIVRQEINKLK